MAASISRADSSAAKPLAVMAVEKALGRLANQQIFGDPPAPFIVDAVVNDVRNLFGWTPALSSCVAATRYTPPGARCVCERLLDASSSLNGRGA